MGLGKSKLGGGNGQKTSSEPKAITELLKEDKFYEGFEKVENFQDFYRAFYEVIEKLNKQDGAMEFSLPSKEELEKSFKNNCPSGKKLGKAEFKAIVKELLFKAERFSIGKGGLDVIMFLFGIPVIAVLAKRVIPGADSVSDDVVIPIATCGTVVALVKTHKL